MNVGNTAASYTDGQGNVWAADNGYSGGATGSTANVISGTADPVLFQAQRFYNHAYTFAVPAGTYAVRLRFAEFSVNGAGLRKFNVYVNTVLTDSNVDVWSLAGGQFKALDRSYPGIVMASAGNLTVQLSAWVDAPILNALEVTQTSGGGGGGGGGSDYITDYTYHTALGKLAQVSMTRGATTQTRTFTYNGQGQLYQAANPETGTVTYAYNANGQVQTFTDAKG